MIAGHHSISFVLRSSGCNFFYFVQDRWTLLLRAQPWGTCRKWLHRTPPQRGIKQRVSRCKGCTFLIHLASCFFSSRDSCMLGLWKLQHMSAQFSWAYELLLEDLVRQEGQMAIGLSDGLCRCCERSKSWDDSPTWHYFGEWPRSSGFRPRWSV